MSSYATLEDDRSSAGNNDRIVVIGVDSSSRAEHAFDWYMEHLHKPENKVVVVHSIEVHANHLYPSVFVRQEVFQAELDKETVNAKGLEERFLQKLKERKVDGEYKTEIGKPGIRIVQVSNELKAEMIIVGTRGRGKIRRTILGSVSDYVVHHAYCPVITVRKKARI